MAAHPTQGNSSKGSVAQRVRDHLDLLEPLSVVRLSDLYASLEVSQAEEASARAELYRTSAGTPVSQRSRPSRFHSIRLSVPLPAGGNEELFLALPGGVPVERLGHDRRISLPVAAVIKNLQEKYGKVTIDYWCRAAQRRSVDIARPAMTRARKRDETCRVCAIAPLEPPDGERQPVHACHVLTRRASFWLALERVDKEGINLFTEAGATRVQECIKSDPFHNDERYIILLCRDHDKLLAASLQHAVAS